jgi:hypothetical protein
MTSGIDFQAWNNDNRGSFSDAYTGAQGQDNLNANDNSLETSAGTWVIIFDDTGYTGNCKKIPPSTYLDSLSDTHRHDNSGKEIGNWKNEMQSFILYKQKPAFWDTGSDYTQPSKSQLFVLHNGQATVAENYDYLGNNRTFAAPYNGSNTSNIGYTTSSTQMSGAGSISSLKVGPNAWMIIFDDTDAKGNFKKVNPNVAENNLSEWTRIDIDGNNIGNWKNEIDSFLLYPAQPGFWPTKYPRAYIDFVTLYNLFPDPTSKSTDDDIEYVVEDSTYKIDEPEFLEQSTTQQLSIYVNDDTTDLPTDGWTKYHVYQQHENTGSHNDKAEYDVYFDNNGKLVSIQRFEWSSDGAFQVPQTIIKSVDLVAWYLGTASSLVSFGVGKEVADAFIEVFNFVCNVFNKIANVVYKATDNGGQFYFLPVICHTLNRVCTTVATPFNRTAYTDPSDPRNNYKMSFSNTGFPSALNNALSGNGSANNWMQGANGKISTFNQVVEFTYKNNPYRTWYQESSVSAQLGMFVSCKIDYEIGDNSKDDHIILLMGFAIPSEGHVPVISFAQVIVQFTDGSNTNIQSNAYNTDVINSIYNDLKNKLAGASMNSSQQGRQYIADITRANMNAINTCMSYS